MKLRIVHIIPALGKGGAERIVLNTVQALQNYPDVIVKLITFREENAYSFLSKGLDWEVIPAKVVPSIRRKSTIEIDALQNALKAFNPHIIHTHLFEAEIVSKALRLENCVYFTHFHDNMSPFQKLSFRTITSKNRILRYYERTWLLHRYQSPHNQFIAISKNGLAYLKQNLPKRFQPNIHLLPNGIELQRFRCQRKTLTKPKHTTMRLISIGSLVEKKDHAFLLDAMHWLVHNGYNCSLTIVGEGVLRPFLQEKIQRLSLTNHVTLTGYSEQPELLLKESDIYVHAAKKEPFGLVLVEAMAAGLPIVTTDGGGNRDLIEEGTNGFMISQRNPEIFAQKIAFLIDNPKKREQLGENAQVFSENFGIEQYVARLKALYESAIKAL